MGFQTFVNTDLPYAIAGDFASANPHASVLAGPGALTAGAAGVTVGLFAWARNDTGVVSNAHPGVLSRIGFVQRDQRALITAWLGQASNVVPSGLEMTLFNSGDFWAKFAAAVTIGQKVFANYADGSAVGGTAGTPITGTPGNVTTTSGSPNLTAVAPTLLPGMPISGTGIPAATYIVSVGAGTAVMSANATASATVSATPTTAFETNFFIESAAGNGELAKISTRA